MSTVEERRNKWINWYFRTTPLERRVAIRVGRLSVAFVWMRV